MLGHGRGRLELAGWRGSRWLRLTGGLERRRGGSRWRRRWGGARRLRLKVRMDDHAVACQARGLHQFVVDIDRELLRLLVDQGLDEGIEILGVERGCRRGEPTGDVQMA